MSDRNSDQTFISRIYIETIKVILLGFSIYSCFIYNWLLLGFCFFMMLCIDLSN